MDVDEELEPPDGYHFASTFKYPMRILLFIRFLPAFMYPVLYLLAFLGIFSENVFRGLASLGVQVCISIVWFSADIVRGLIQRGICHMLGYEISFYTLFMALLEPTFAAHVGQFQCRRDALLIAVAPLSLFLLLGIPLFFKLPVVISCILAFVLIINLCGTAWDLYFIGWLLRKPRGTLLYTENLLVLCVFEPESDGRVHRA